MSSSSVLLHISIFVAQVILAGVFGIAGFAKVVDRSGSRQALRDFGVPTRLSGALGTLLPVAELIIAGALLVSPLARWGAIAALALLVLFAIGISTNLMQGRKPDCHCFGQLHSKPVGWPTLVRNGLLAAIAGMLVWQGPVNYNRTLIPWVSTLTTLEIVAFFATVTAIVVLIAEGWLLQQLWRQNGRLLLRMEKLEMRLVNGAPGGPSGSAPQVAGLPIGVPAPSFRLTSLDGSMRSLDALLHAVGKPLLLLFSDPDCGPCNTLLPEVAHWQREHAEKLTIVLITRGTLDVNRRKTDKHGLTQVLVQNDREVAQAYQVVGTPGAVIIRPHGTIGSLIATGRDAIRQLVSQAISAEGRDIVHGTNGDHKYAGERGAPESLDALTRPALKIGESAPDLKLLDLHGRILDLAELRGRETLLVFWNPRCGFCARMLNDLKAWEISPPPGAPELLIVSIGGVEENKAMGLRSPIVLDPGFGTARAFGSAGTPSAVLVDARGNIASELVMGAANVLALASLTPTISSLR